ncbi:low-affinity inorganic phosphate transporter [Fictibacillus macauensis ZFHKF-1]|uniref:Low-affinity inorganic phosphate transporter n=1 Tax=Fictibacillus macauensis ZFHKF-1 TaxID=1196324 RepID=I8UIS9_9BACL|nr:inorganic phosphate transporter [Fictibacillus macauensis]EIT86800.1 low-affinity inorganic phosphate transporter [Fictibacillus macauensis ZFHKF-1]
MDTLFVLIVLIAIFAFAFDFINGFHDTANAIATSVSTKALPPKVAIALAATMNFVGALTFTGVAKSISKDIVDPFQFSDGKIGLTIVLSALISGIAWNLVTWYFGIPSSSSHAIIGSIAGAAISAKGFGVLNYGGFVKIIEALIISPFVALAVGFIIMTLFAAIFKNFNKTKTNKGFRSFQVFTAALQSFSHGTNDAQKAMGIITLALVSGKYLNDSDGIPMWVRFGAALAMGIGTSIGGWKIIKTVGGKIMKLQPVNGAAADLSSSIIIFTFTALKLPVSTTHVISSAIMGVGSAKRVKGVKWGVARRIVMTWIITLPISAIVASIIYQILHLFV